MSVTALVARKARSNALVEVFVKRWASASAAGAGAGAGAAANRIAGRARFYKQVGTTLLDVKPWDEEINKPHNLSIESPISAGVDGSQSASGIHHIPRRKHSETDEEDSFKSMIAPNRSEGKYDCDVGRSSNNCTTTSWYGVTLDGRTRPVSKLISRNDNQASRPDQAGTLSRDGFFVLSLALDLSFLSPFRAAV